MIIYMESHEQKVNLPFGLRERLSERGRKREREREGEIEIEGGESGVKELF